MPQPKIHGDHAARQAAYRKRQARAHKEHMRARGLPALPTLATMPGRARWSAGLLHATEMLTTMREEMQEYYDERSDAWKQGDRASDMEEHLKEIDKALGHLEDIYL